MTFKLASCRDVLIVSFANSATSIFSGFVIFSGMGYMSQLQGKAVADIATEGRPCNGDTVCCPRCILSSWRNTNICIFFVKQENKILLALPSTHCYSFPFYHQNINLEHQKNRAVFLQAFNGVLFHPGCNVSYSAGMWVTKLCTRLYK